MKNNFMKVEDVAEELKVSESHAYKIMRQLNKELREKGLLTVSGRLSRKYFLERTCYGAVEEKEER